MRRPGIDAELVATLAEIKALMPPLTLEGLSQLRGLPSPPVESLLEGRAIEHEELEAPGPDGAPDLKLSVYRPSAAGAPGPCVYFIHGGGMVLGDRFTNIDLALEWVDLLGVTLVSVEYRLAPEHQGTALVDWVGRKTDGSGAVVASGTSVFAIVGGRIASVTGFSS